MNLSIQFSDKFLYRKNITSEETINYEKKRGKKRKIIERKKALGVVIE